MPPRVLALNIQLPEGAAVPPGSPLLVELRDTSLADAPAVSLKQVRSTITRSGTSSVQITMDPGSIPEGTTVWVHLDVDRDGRVSVGDYITVESYPAAVSGPQEMTIRLKRV
jgi:putative lipoprotein